ncbi:hypothetical protein [Streptomyces sp. NPDC005281]|uniref:hypothetical protein n=1 Tax=Streptomyces sp. NPDC005281 TaxID=3155712 RepID=UPI0033B4370F
MTKWIEKYNGLSMLGVERTRDYRGYVVRVQGTEGDLPERWFTYAYDQEDRHTYWIGMTNSEDDAKAVLERMLSEGWLCEVYVSEHAGHCKEQAVLVKHTWYERKSERLRTLLCERHGHIFPEWEDMTIREYVNTYNGLEQDAPILGKRL